MTIETKEIKKEQRPAELRRCLCCGEDFPSEGPHNRICKRCKSSQTWRQG